MLLSKRYDRLSVYLIMVNWNGLQIGSATNHPGPSARLNVVFRPLVQEIPSEKCTAKFDNKR